MSDRPHPRPEIVDNSTRRGEPRKSAGDDAGLAGRPSGTVPNTASSDRPHEDTEKLRQMAAAGWSTTGPFKNLRAPVRAAADELDVLRAEVAQLRADAEAWKPVERERARLFATEVELYAVAREYLPQAIGFNTLPEIFAGIARQRDTQHEYKDHLADVARKLTERAEAAEADLATARQALTAIADLHQPSHDQDGIYGDIGDCWHCEQPWPCPTARLVQDWRANP